MKREESGVVNCYNLGDLDLTDSRITYSSYVAGICGKPPAVAPINCYNSGNIVGDIVAPIMILYSMGGLTGEMINCYCEDEKVTPKSDEGYFSNEVVIYLSSENLKGGASLLGDAFCSDDEGINKGYPILKWQKNN